MFRRYSGNAKARPGVLTVTASDPVLGFSPGSGACCAVLRGLGSVFCSFSAGLGGGVGTVFVRGLGSTLVGAGASAGGRVTVSGAGFCSGLGAGAATNSTA